jgi:hypothetical protein
MRPIRISRALLAADPDGIALAQQLVGAGNLTLNGAFVAGGTAYLTAQRRVGLTSAGNLSAVNYTVYGTNEAGIVISETLAGPNANTVSTTLDFFTVTRIAASAANATDITAGTTDVGASLPIPLDYLISPFQVTAALEIQSGAVNATLQYTLDNIFEPGPIVWFNDTILVGVAVNTVTSYVSPVRACRLVTNSGTGAAVLQLIQAGTGL